MAKALGFPWPLENDLFSEFSYGFALTNELVSREPRIISPPIFPSLVREGRAGGGYDVALDRPGKPLFLQFKLSQYMKGHSALERKLKEMETPFFRMHLRSRKKSQQHVLLRDLEVRGLGEVFYCAPAFSNVGQLTRYYQQKRVEAESRFVRPSELPEISDDKDHWLSFAADNSIPTRFYSEKSTLIELSALSLRAHAEETLATIPEHRPLREYIADLAEWFSHLDRAAHTPPTLDFGEERSHALRLLLLDRVAIAAHTLLNCSLSIIQAPANRTGATTSPGNA